MDKGCSLGYVAHSDPGGQLPVWVTNKLSTILAPKMVKRLHKACKNYNHWKVSKEATEILYENLHIFSEPSQPKAEALAVPGADF